MTVLMVGPYPPYRDGIAAYTVQEVKRLRAAGEDVEVLSPLPSAAHHFVHMGGMAGMAELARRVHSFDRVIIQFFPEIIFGKTRVGAQRLAVWGMLGFITRTVPTEIRIHEIQWQPMEEHESERSAAARVLQQAKRVTVHTELEQRRLASAAGIDASEIEIIEHGENFEARSQLTKAEARTQLGLDHNKRILLSIGFLQAHKGFDNAMKAFHRVNPDNAELHVVGDIRIDDPALVAHVARLEDLANSAEGVHLHRGYVGDAEFDTWIIASDTLVLPYREIWSSGVLERARLFNRPVIAARVGGLEDQSTELVTLVDTDAELVAAIADAAQSVAPVSTDEQSVDLSQSDLQALISSRAATATGPTDGPATATMNELPLLVKPRVTSHRAGIGTAKRTVDALTNFQIHPIVEHLNRLHGALRSSVRSLEERIAELERRADQ